MNLGCTLTTASAGDDDRDTDEIYLDRNMME